MTTTFDQTMHVRREVGAGTRTLKGGLGTPDLGDWAGGNAANDTARGRKRSWPTGSALVTVGVVLAAAAWHFLPLHHRVDVANATDSTMRGVVLRVGGEEIAAGDLAPGQSFGHTFFQRRHLGSAIEAYAMIDGKRQRLGQCGNGVLASTRTHVSLHGSSLDERDCRTVQPDIGRLP